MGALWELNSWAPPQMVPVRIHGGSCCRLWGPEMCVSFKPVPWKFWGELPH